MARMADFRWAIVSLKHDPQQSVIIDGYEFTSPEGVRQWLIEKNFWEDYEKWEYLFWKNNRFKLVQYIVMDNQAEIEAKITAAIKLDANKQDTKKREEEMEFIDNLVTKTTIAPK